LFFPFLPLAIALPNDLLLASLVARKDREIMLRLALDKAARSWDPDLMNSAISAACMGDPCERGSDIQSCARLIKEKLYELQVVGRVGDNTF